MNGRKLYREYLTYLGKDCKEFVELKQDWDGFLDIKYKDSNSYPQTHCLNPKDMLDWIVRAFSNEAFSSMKRLTKND